MLRRMLSRSILAIRAPVAVLYVGGGVYLGGGSGNVAGVGDGDRERERDDRPDLRLSLRC